MSLNYMSINLFIYFPIAQGRAQDDWLEHPRRVSRNYEIIQKYWI